MAVRTRDGAFPVGWSDAGRWATPLGRRWADRAGLATLALLTLGLAAYLVGGGTVVGQDSATQFYPWYAFLGESLREGRLPVWNPAQFAGAPFAADPQSGWTYLPAMLLFTFLPLATAAGAFVVLHLALAGGGAYALARALRIGPLGSLTAAGAFEFSGLSIGRSVCCPAHVQVGAWLPFLLLGVELALRSEGLARRLAWLGLSGFALSQILASWLGQGSYYALLLLGAFVAYRTLLDPPPPDPGPRFALAADSGSRSSRVGRYRGRAGVSDRGREAWRRIGLLAFHGGVVLAFGFGLAAAGLLPRLEYNQLSNVAGGRYQGQLDYAAVVGGWSTDGPFLEPLGRSLYYPGVATLVLATLAIVLARGRHASPFFVVVGLAAAILATPAPTPLHRLLYALLPRFQDLHQHWPERVAIVGFIAPALLAGAAVDALPSWANRRRLLGLLAAVPLAVVGAAVVAGGGETWREPVVWPAVAVGLALAVVAVRPRHATLIPPVLLAVLLLDLFGAAPRILARGPYGGFHRIELGSYYDASGAARFLQDRASSEGPFRFFGYDPALDYVEDGQLVLYRYQFADPITADLIVNNRATILGLQDVQGYNPVQLQAFVDYLAALNGHPQEYHDANVYPGGLDSPLLDLLNARYVVVPSSIPADRADLQALVDRYPTVYQDHAARVLENTEALPRAWIVHQARRTAAPEALDLLAEGSVDPRQVAILSEPPPPLGLPADPSADRATVTDYGADRLTIAARTTAPGLLVLSEVAYPAWRAYVDGEPVELLVANGLFRAVPLPAGDHTVELRYESTTLRAGLAISLLTAALLGGVLGSAYRQSRGRRGDSAAE